MAGSTATKLTLGQTALIGATEGLTGSATGQLITTGKIDPKRLVLDTALSAGTSVGANKLTAMRARPSGVDAGARARELQAALPEGSQGRVTMAVGTGKDASGKIRTVIGTSEPGGYLRPGVRDAVQAGEEIAPGLKHAEQDILDYMEANGITPGTVGAGRPICQTCAQAIEGAGASPASPLKVAVS